MLNAISCQQGAKVVQKHSCFLGSQWNTSEVCELGALSWTEPLLPAMLSSAQQVLTSSSFSVSLPHSLSVLFWEPPQTTCMEIFVSGPAFWGTQSRTHKIVLLYLKVMPCTTLAKNNVILNLNGWGERTQRVEMEFQKKFLNNRILLVPLWVLY